jgi:hypothetical protein
MNMPYGDAVPVARANCPSAQSIRNAVWQIMPIEITENTGSSAGKTPATTKASTAHKAPAIDRALALRPSL